MHVRTIILQGGNETRLVVDERCGLLCKQSTGKFLLSPILSVPSEGMIGFAKAVTLPVRTVIDFIGRLIRMETGATMNPVEKPEMDGEVLRL